VKPDRASYSLVDLPSPPNPPPPNQNPPLPTTTNHSFLPPRFVGSLNESGTVFIAPDQNPIPDGDVGVQLRDVFSIRSVVLAAGDSSVLCRSVHAWSFSKYPYSLPEAGYRTIFISSYMEVVGGVFSQQGEDGLTFVRC